MADGIFQKTLQDLIKGIRSHKRDASAFISQHVVDIKAELRSVDVGIKAEAIRKLTYLQMIGYNISWASFAIVEVMSQPRFSFKRIGCMAANQSFNDQTDVILLTTNLFKKDFAMASYNQYELGVSINCLANIATKDLARDCIADLVGLMNHTRPYVRKKAVLAMYKLYIKYPQGLRLTFEKLKERLDDSDPAVVSTAVNVICELSNKNPRNYLAMAPKFFRLLTTSSNNWMLIKVVKLLGSLVSEEPRLARKLLEPLATILQNTGAKSLQYECIATITEALPFTRREDGTDSKAAPVVVKLCSDYLRGFVVDNDQNLKYLGLVGLVNLMKSHPRSVVEHRELVLRCLGDEDVTIRTRALELLAGIVSRKSLVDLVHHLLEHVKLAEGTYRDELISKILYMCSKEKYSLVTDFAWYISILQELAVMQGSKHGKEVANQLIEIALRVDSIRPYAVDSMLSLVLNETLILGQARSIVAEVLKAAAWIIGEYAAVVTSIANDSIDTEDGPTAFWIEGPNGDEVRSVWRGQLLHQQVLAAMLHPRTTNLPPQAQAAFIQAAMKVFICACNDCSESVVAALVGIVRAKLAPFLQSVNIEVQERASTFRQLLASLGILSLSWKTDLDAALTKQKDGSNKSNTNEQLLWMSNDARKFSSTQEIDASGATACKTQLRLLRAITAEGFYAVHSKAQKRVPVPEGIDLSTPINRTAFDELKAVRIPELQSLTNLSFANATSAYSSSTSSTNSYFNAYDPANKPISDEEESKLSKLASAWGDVDDRSRGAQGSASSSSSSAKVPYEAVRNPENSLFYLSSNSRTSAVSSSSSLMQSLAESFDDQDGDKKKRKKDKSKGKRKSKHDAEIDIREMLPANAVSSDDEFEASGKRAGGGSKKAGSSGRRRGGEDGLDSVDLTTPLRADEVFTVLKHREVEAPKFDSNVMPVTSAVSESGELTEKKEKKKSSKDKDKDSKRKDKSDKDKPKEKSKDKSKEKSKEKLPKEDSKSKKSKSTSSAAATDDLLDLGFDMPVSSSSAAVDTTWKDRGPSSAEAAPHQDPALSAFAPHVVDIDGFALLISKSSSKLSSGQVTMRFDPDNKLKKVFKSLASLLHAHAIESESSKSGSFCSRHGPTGAVLCVLAKANKEKSVLTVDLKCLSAGKAETQMVIDTVLASLSKISL